MTVRQNNYEVRFDRVLAYIYEHLDEDLDLIKLAEIACLSPYHWHRIYRGIYGESIVATVKRLRLHRAAGYLAQTDMTIERVACKSGYRNVQSFTRIFKAEYGLPPAQYRHRGSHTRFLQQTMNEVLEMYDIEIRKVPKLKTASLSHSGSYMNIGKAFDTLFGTLNARSQFTPNMRTIGIYYDDPEVVPENELRSRACVIVGEDFKPEAPLQEEEVAAGSYAVLTYKGPYSDMLAAYNWFYGEWLTQSGHEAGDAPVFEEYLNDPRNTSPAELLTDIYLPLRA